MKDFKSMPARKVISVTLAVIVYAVSTGGYHTEAQTAAVVYHSISPILGASECSSKPTNNDNPAPKPTKAITLGASFPDITIVTIEETGFTPLDISLPLYLQEHTWLMCKKHPTALSQKEFYDLVLRVMWQESSHRVNIPDNHNTNGSVDRGLMQINSINWNRMLRDYGLDINDTRQNIEAGVLILSQLINRHPLEHALTAYNMGEYGALRVSGQSRYSARVLSASRFVE